MNEEEQIKIFNSGVEAGKAHSFPSSETMLHINAIKEEISVMRDEWKEVKNKAIGWLVTALFVVVGYGIWVGSIQTTMTENRRISDRMILQIDDVNKKQQATDITAAEIRTKLSGIEASLIEIKQALKIK